MSVVDPWAMASQAIIAGARRQQWMYDPALWAADCIAWPGGEGLTSYQADAVTRLATQRRTAIRGPHGLGKALALDTPIPTPTGWDTVQELRPGSEVYDEQGRPCRVVGKSATWLGDTWEVEFGDGAVITTNGDHEWNVVDVYHRPRTPKPNRRPIPVTDWREHWAVTRRVTTVQMAAQLRTRGGQLRWRIPVARALELPSVELPVDPYLFGYWLGDEHSASSEMTVHTKDWPHLQTRIAAAGYHGSARPDKRNSDTLTVTISTQPVKTGGDRRDSLNGRLRALGVLDNKHIPMAYLRASVEQRRELVRGLWDADGYRQAGGCDEITLTRHLAEGTAELLRSLGLATRVSESDARLTGCSVGRRWRIAARFDFNPYRMPRYGWEPRGRQASRHTQRTITDIRRAPDAATQCIEVDSPSRLFLAGRSMVPTHNSTTAAVSVLWFATTREMAGRDWKAIITASAWRHLAVYLMPEIAKWARRLRWDVLGLPEWTSNELLALSIKLRHGAATAVASNKPELIEGAHADSLLYVLDEAKVIKDGTWDAVEGAFSGGRPDGLPEAFALAISTPGPPAGRFYEIHKRAAGLEDWNTRHVTVDEAIAAERISGEWVEQRRRQWGEDSAMFQNRVLGEFHSSDEDSVIPLAWVEAAVERWREWDAAGRPEQEGVRAVGVDVARTGGDSTILAHRWGPVVVGLDAYDRQDTMGTVARVQGALGGGEVVPVVDSAGVGGGVVDRLRELRVPVEAYTGAARTSVRTRDREYGFANTRSAALWRVRELLDPAHGAVLALPDDDVLVSDLTTPTWDIATGDPPKIRVEAKERLVARLGRSPDRGDAVMMALWGDVAGVPVVRSPARAGSGGGTLAGVRYGRPVGGRR